MTMADSPLPSLAATAALYQTKVSQVNVSGPLWVRVLAADPRRYYVRFQGAIAGGSGPFVMPAPGQNMPVPAGSDTVKHEQFWRDCPSIVAGEWYAAASAGADIWIIECLYVGG